MPATNSEHTVTVLMNITLPDDKASALGGGVHRQVRLDGA